jgi:hypothetical protein
MDTKPIAGHIDNIFIWYKAQSRDESGNLPIIIPKENKNVKEPKNLTK